MAPTEVNTETRWVAQVDHPMSPLMPRRVALRLSDGSLAPAAFSSPWWRRSDEVLHVFEELEWPVNREDVVPQSAWHRQLRTV